MSDEDVEVPEAAVSEPQAPPEARFCDLAGSHLVLRLTPQGRSFRFDGQMDAADGESYLVEAEWYPNLQLAQEGLDHHVLEMLEKGWLRES